MNAILLQSSLGPISRRDFLLRTMAASAAAAACCIRPSGAVAAAAPGAKLSACPIVVFSKIYQELKLDFAEAAALTAEAGLDGIDCPVRPGGEVLPERVEEDLPRYVEALKKEKRQLDLLTTSIVNPATPHTEKVLTAAKKLGVRYYRLGFFKRQEGVAWERQANEIRSGFKELAALNKQYGLVAMFQNHQGSVGADLGEARQLLEGLDPAVFGMAFDIGHALAVHREGWAEHFEALKAHLSVAYIKDVQMGGGWVPFGEGAIPKTDYFKRLKALNYAAPFSLHIEFDWSQKGKSKTRESLLKALRESTQTLRRWLAEA